MAATGAPPGLAGALLKGRTLKTIKTLVKPAGLVSTEVSIARSEALKLIIEFQVSLGQAGSGDRPYTLATVNA